MLLEKVDRSIYEYLRRKVVGLGYLPNIRDYDTPEEYQAARATLSATLNSRGERMIDVYGVGSWESRGEKTDCKFTVERRDMSSGKLGFSGIPVYTEVRGNAGDLTGYKKGQMPDKTVNIEYEVRYMCTTVKMERILLAILDVVFGKGSRSMKGVNEEGDFIEEDFILIYNGTADVRHREFIEGFVRLTASDIYLENQFKDVDIDVPMLTEIKDNVFAVSREELKRIRTN